MVHPVFYNLVHSNCVTQLPEFSATLERLVQLVVTIYASSTLFHDSLITILYILCIRNVYRKKAPLVLRMQLALQGEANWIFQQGDVRCANNVSPIQGCKQRWVNRKSSRVAPRIFKYFDPILHCYEEKIPKRIKKQINLYCPLAYLVYRKNEDLCEFKT